MTRVTEEQLVLPALFLMDNSPDNTVNMSDLIKGLEEIFKPTGEDTKILSGRTDTKFSQIVRNLKSHDTFKRSGYAEYKKNNDKRNGYFSITEKGKKYLLSHMEIVQYLLNNNFSSEDLKSSFKIISLDAKRSKTIKVFDENLNIKEGTSKIIASKVYVRSLQLRNIAIEHYMSNNRIKCMACCFDFEEFYGKYGKGFIEIHHKNPVFMFEDEDLNSKIDKALSNVVPVCSNCHRIIHRDRKNQLSLEVVKSYIPKDLSFCR